MKRIHLFEFEDFSWFPRFLRKCLTRYIQAIHRLLNTDQTLAELLVKVLPKRTQPQIIDLCSGSGGPMPDVLKIIRKQVGLENTRLLLTDLYPDLASAVIINKKNDQISYLTEPVDASQLGDEHPGLRTMICSMHHMKPETVKSILRSAMENRQPILTYEISDNSFPKWIWWISIPINIIMVLFITPMVRPMSWQQVVFTYIIPLLPLIIAWDGAVSNARTYTLDDLDIILKDLKSDDYTWEKDAIPGKGGRKIYLMGRAR